MIANKLTIEFNKIAGSVTACKIAVGMITDQMYDFAHRHLKNCEDIQIITGVHMATSPSVMRKLKDQTDQRKMQTGAFIKNFFHPKLYLFKQPTGWIAFVGSGNFTNGGWKDNEELFVKITDQKVCEALSIRFSEWFSICEPLSDNLIDLYTQSYTSNNHLDQEKKKSIDMLLDQLNSNFNLDLIEFNYQFFKREDHMAFRPGVTHLDTLEILEERKMVRKKLFMLNSLLAVRIPSQWRLVPHYDSDHIVSHIETKNHHNAQVKSLWIGYGRDKSMLKKYDKYEGSNNTPLFFMRMQVIISYNKVGVWLMPGKNNAGQIDREHFLGKMNDGEYSKQFFKLLTGLGDPYWIEVADDKQPVSSFTAIEALKAYLSKDNWRHFYFIIGRDYDVNDEALSEKNIITTCLSDFQKYQPIYEQIRDKSFE